jgi:hypothetical protein
MNRRIIILILLAGLLAGCAPSPLRPSITVTSGSGTLSVHGTGFSPVSPCAHVTLEGMPQYPLARAIGQGFCDTHRTFDLEWAYSLVGYNCVPNQQVSATVFAIDTQAYAGADQTITMPWGSNCALASQTGTSSIAYSLELLPGSVESGSLGNVQFSDADITLFFAGDTSNVIPFAVYQIPFAEPFASGYEILAGTASVVIDDGSGTLLQGEFLPGAGIFVSVDNQNGGVGFGSFGVPPWDPNFPILPVYPMGVAVGRIPVSTYDLKSAIFVSGDVISCVNFPILFDCGGGVALPTTAGPLILNPNLSGEFGTGYFSAQKQ